MVPKKLASQASQLLYSFSKESHNGISSNHLPFPFLNDIQFQKACEFAQTPLHSGKNYLVPFLVLIPNCLLE